jgi:hypothetical protein
VWHLYQPPAGGAGLDVEPVLASWDKAGAPSQVRLSRFLDHAESVAAPMSEASGRPLVLELTVGLAPGVPLFAGGRDLDNYLYPLVNRLGPTHFRAVFAHKRHGSPSRLAVGPARQVEMTAQPHFAMRATGSAVLPAWKANIRQQLLAAGVRILEPGPVSMRILLATGASRNWANLWKALLDAFGPVLGERDGKPFDPHDDRITDLAFHHQVDPGLGHDVIITAWWRPAGAGGEEWGGPRA